jgi:transposase-like protein
LPHPAGTKISGRYNNKGEEKTGTKDQERRVYPKEFKAEAAALAQKHEKPVRQASADLDINENMLHRRIQQPREAGNKRRMQIPMRLS